MNARMHALLTYRLDETFRSGLAVFTSFYAFLAPDTFEVRNVAADGSGSRIVWIKDTRYLQTLPDGVWQIERGSAPTVPLFVWDSFTPAMNARLVGHEVVDGVRTSVVIFFGGDAGLPVWFRMWIDHSGLVRRAEMRTLGHFMADRYVGFDEPLALHRPAINSGTGGAGG